MLGLPIGDPPSFLWSGLVDLADADRVRLLMTLEGVSLPRTRAAAAPLVLDVSAGLTRRSFWVESARVVTVVVRELDPIS